MDRGTWEQAFLTYKRLSRQIAAQICPGANCMVDGTWAWFRHSKERLGKIIRPACAGEVTEYLHRCLEAAKCVAAECGIDLDWDKLLELCKTHGGEGDWGCWATAAHDGWLGERARQLAHWLRAVKLPGKGILTWRPKKLAKTIVAYVREHPSEDLGDPMAIEFEKAALDPNRWEEVVEACREYREERWQEVAELIATYERPL